MAKPKTSKPPRSPAQEAADRRNISRLYLKGLLQAEIASELGLSQSTVSRDLNLLFDEWKKERIYDINEAKARELARIDNLELEYWEAWERSQEAAKKRRKKQTNLPEGNRQEAEETSEERVGDPRFLSGVQWCIEQRCKILGVESPKEIDGEKFTAPQLVEIIKTYEEKRR